MSIDFFISSFKIKCARSHLQYDEWMTFVVGDATEAVKVNGNGG